MSEIERALSYIADVGAKLRIRRINGGEMTCVRVRLPKGSDGLVSAMARYVHEDDPRENPISDTVVSIAGDLREWDQTPR